MTTSAERRRMNNFLANRGFATLDDPSAMVRQMGFIIPDHDGFRALLATCEPEYRTGMYNALKPHLRFEAKPLDVYLAEAGSMAEAKQLPTIGDDGGSLQPFRAREIMTPEYIAQQALEQALLQHHLTVTCRKCTKQAQFHGARKADAVQAAREAGWVYDTLTGAGREICPDCPGGNSKGEI